MSALYFSKQGLDWKAFLSCDNTHGTNVLDGRW